MQNNEPYQHTIQSVNKMDSNQIDKDDWQIVSQSINQSNNDLTQQSQKQQHRLTNKFYRPDIDGLRAIAVLIVVIFHAWPQFMKGGFIGVDIFFVISGYLISSIIIKQISQNKFSYLQFYSRRIKRIYPALIIVLICVFMFACFILMKRQLKLVSHTMAAATIFGANIQLLTYEQDYFDPDLKTNSLLHLWSLGVEQQFYIIWPVVIFFTTRYFSHKNGFLVLTVFTILSFGCGMFSLYQDTKFAFYFPFCRFWEMALGGIVAYKNINIKNKYIQNLLSISALLFILTTIWIIDEDSLFPGYWALIPTLSAVFIIVSSNQSFINKFILSNKLIIFIGKISYPLYLWHWPLLVYSRLLFPEGSTSIFAKPQTMILIAIIMSILTYYLVQNQLRYRKSKRIVITLSIIMLLIGCVAYQTNKKPQLFSFQDLQLQEEFQDSQQFLNQIFEKHTQQINFNIDEEKQLIKKQNQKNQTIIKQQHKIKIPLNKQKQQNRKENLQIKQNKTQKTQFSNNQKTQKVKPDNKQRTQSEYIKPKVNSYQQALMPSKDDFYFKLGRKHINSSKNRHRLPATVQKIKMSINNPNYKNYFKRITTSSKYYQKNVAGSSLFHILNEGKQNKLFVVGDSHAFYIAPRFHQLYVESIQKNNSNNFPTIVLVVQAGDPYLPCNSFFNNSLNYVKKHMPQRVFFKNFWLNILQYNDKFGPFHQVLNCEKRPKPFRTQNPNPNFTIHPQVDYGDAFIQSQKNNRNINQKEKTRSFRDTLRNLKYYTQAMKYLVSLGIEVYASSINPSRLTAYDPKTMMDFNGIIQNNIKPIRLSQFKKNNKQIIDLFQSAMKSVGVNLIDISQNMCWQDICQVLTPSGYPIMKDSHHFTYRWSQYWASELDFLIQ